MIAVTRVPAPGADQMSTEPPTAAMRSVTLDSPFLAALAGSKPGPVSDTVNLSSSARVDTATAIVEFLACRSAFWIASMQAKYAALSVA